jgi:two-component system cell cycle sensor histidine kinase/response regulator CckA
LLKGHLFKACPASLWVDDFSPLMARLDELRASGVSDLRAHFAAHPEFLFEAIGLIRAVHVNPASLKMFEAESEEELLRRMPEVFTEGTLPVFQAEIELLFDGGTFFQGELGGQTLGGRPLDILLQMSVPGDPPDYSQVLFTLIDITARCAAERRVEDLWDNAPEANLAVDPRTLRVTEVNRTWARLTGFERGWAVARPITDLLHPDDGPALRQAFEQLASGTPVSGLEARARRADGSTVPVEVEGAAVVGADGALIGSRWSWRDISELKAERAARVDAEMEARLQQAQKLESLGVLAGGIAHDFNNLLVGVLGNIELAEMSLSPMAPARDHLRRAQQASERAAELCRQMLAYSGKGRFFVEPLDVSELVEEMVQLLSVSVPKNVVLNLQLDRTLPLVRADGSQLRQVVMNLITNAAESFEEDGGVVGLRTSSMHCDRAWLDALGGAEELPEGRYVQLEVSDTGQGMDVATRERIFEPFFTTKFTGRGLGLAAVLGIVRGHSGTLKVYSELGQGTTMKVLLPVTEGKGARPAAAAEPSVPAIGGVVLVVDDEEAVRAVAAQALALIGVDVIQAPDGEQALRRFRERPDVGLVLLDLNMPKMGGEETFRQLRAIRPEVRVILMSGYNEQEVVHRFAGKGLAGFLQKPWSPRRLIEVVSAELSPPDPKGRTAIP